MAHDSHIMQGSINMQFFTHSRMEYVTIESWISVEIALRSLKLLSTLGGLEAMLIHLIFFGENIFVGLISQAELNFDPEKIRIRSFGVNRIKKKNQHIQSDQRGEGLGKYYESFQEQRSVGIF